MGIPPKNIFISKPLTDEEVERIEQEIEEILEKERLESIATSGDRNAN